ncbi:MAG: insulinase family protein [Bacteroidetes bacterium]|nr:insulinase family protein [Bacteroidota bacterium]
MSTIQLAKKIKYNIPSVDFKEHTLDNGLRVVMSKFGNIPVVALNTTFHTGSKDEENDKTGMAHLLEHLMFEGSPNVPRGQFDDILTRNGGESNAYTTRDSTSYFISVPSNHIETAMWLDSDRICGFGITEESLEIQKDVVLEEKLFYVDNSPYGSLEEVSSKKLFGGSSYGWSVIGNMEDLRRLKINDLKHFFEKHYTPSNAVISVVGDIDYDKTLRLLDKYYGNIGSGTEFTKSNFAHSEIRNEIRENIYDNVHLEGKFIFYKLPEDGTKDYYAMNILNSILSDGESSRFFNEIEYKSGLVNEIDSSIFGMECLSIFNITAIAMKGKSMDEIESKIDEIIEDVKSGNISDREFSKARNRFETYFSSKRQSVISIADKFSYLKMFYNDCSKINFEILDYMSLTKSDLIETANKYLNKNQRLVLNYLPK